MWPGFIFQYYSSHLVCSTKWDVPTSSAFIKTIKCPQLDLFWLSHTSVRHWVNKSMTGILNSAYIFCSPHEIVSFLFIISVAKQIYQQATNHCCHRSQFLCNPKGTGPFRRYDKQFEEENILELTVILGARPYHWKQKLLASGRIYSLIFSLAELKKKRNLKPKE